VSFPCQDVRHELYVLPDIEFQPEKIRIVLVSEAAPADLADYYYAAGQPLFQETTLLAFEDAGLKVNSIQELVARGIYLTTAVKCGKTGYGIATPTVQECALLLEKELAAFPALQALLLMGDVAIKALNYIASRNKQPRVVPAVPTYKLRGQEFTYRGIRVFPSYLQAGPSFFIEKSKRKMIAEDIRSALIKGDLIHD
jgi:uracil-DNA glycosylase